MDRFRALPDGTYLDTQTDTVSAPLSGGLGAAGTYPGYWGLRGRVGRNYGALGEMPIANKMMAVAAIIGIAALTVWLNRKRKKAK